MVLIPTEKKREGGRREEGREEEGGKGRREKGGGRREDGKGKNYPLLHVLEVSRWCHYSQLVRAKPARA